MRTLCLLLMAMLVGCSKNAREAEPAGAGKAGGPAALALEGAPARLPAEAGPWTRPASARRITAETIFDYMDGGGELYLAYRFDHLDVLEYKAADPLLGTVLVELYQMQSPDDAFGLLSTDWTGEAIVTGEEPSPTAAPRIDAVPPHRALYGAGLLRVWSGDVYARVLASRESPASRDAVLKIGRALVGGRRSSPPALLSAVAGDVGTTARATPKPGAPLRVDRTCFFRSHLVLNSQYFLASHDILGLGTQVAAATAEYAPPRPGGRPTRLIVVRYASADAAAAAAATFRGAYLAEAAKTPGGAASGTARTEHGFVAWAVVGPGLAIVLDADTASAAANLAGAVARAIPSTDVTPQ
jgi:hypothetical protein